MDGKKRRNSKKKNRSGHSESSLPKQEVSKSSITSIQDQSTHDVASQGNAFPLLNGAANGDKQVKGQLSDGISLGGKVTDEFVIPSEEPEKLDPGESPRLPVPDLRSNSSGLSVNAQPDQDELQAPLEMANVGNEEVHCTEWQPAEAAHAVCIQIEKENHLHDKQLVFELREAEAAKEQLVSELRDALAREAAKAEAHRSMLEEFKELSIARDISEAGTQAEIQQLREEIAQLRETNFQLQKEAGTQAQLREENTQLREESTQLQNEVEEMKDVIERLLLERRQLTAKMVAIQTGMQQLEREATIRARVEDEFAVATAPESSKRWLSWVSTKDPVAEAAAVAEESRIQMAAAATMVEKLVAENSELVEKVNEQSALIDRLSQRYSSLMESQSSGRLKGTVSEINIVLASEKIQEAGKEPAVLQALLEVSSLDTQKVGTHCGDESEAKTKVVPDIVSSLDTRKVETHCGDESEAKTSVVPDIVSSGTSEDAVLPVESEHLRQEISGETTDDPVVNSENANQAGVCHDSTLGSASTKSQELLPFSDAPIMGAPIRFLTFITRFVSGADLVTAERSQ